MQVLNNESNRSQFATLKSGRYQNALMTIFVKQDILPPFRLMIGEKGCDPDVKEVAGEIHADLRR